MQFVSYRRRGDLKINALGDDGKNYHFMNAENAMNWMKTNTTNIPTLTTLTPSTAVALAVSDVTVTLTGTNFTATSEVLINNVPVTRTFASPTSMTTIIKPSLVPLPAVWDISVRNGVYQTAGKPFTFTAT